jgi:hypothetical protein
VAVVSSAAGVIGATVGVVVVSCANPIAEKFNISIAMNLNNGNHLCGLNGSFSISSISTTTEQVVGENYDWNLLM